MRALLLVLLSCAASAQAEIYRCTVNGEVVFSDSKCASGAVKLDVAPQQPDLENAAHLQKQSEKINKEIDATMKKPRRADAYERRIEALEEELQELQKQLAAEQEELRRRHRRPSEKRQLSIRLKALEEEYAPRLSELVETLRHMRERR